MDKFERAFVLDRLFKTKRGPVSMQELCEYLECSESTVKRAIRDLKRLGAPLYFNTRLGGYLYGKHKMFELPGVWFSPEELHALLSFEQLTGQLSGGLFQDGIRQLRDKAVRLLGKNSPAPDQMRRIRVLGAGARAKSLPMFSLVATGVLQRKRLHLLYHGRQRNKPTEREVSPQRLVHYRNNWYLDAWCHLSGGLRTFAVERIQRARLLKKRCREISEAVLDRKLAHSFGIFGGEPTATAVLRFTEKAARWVRDEEWFPDQVMRELDDGELELEVPYNNPTELMMEILRYGPDVEVVSPPELRHATAERLQAASKKYASEVKI